MANPTNRGPQQQAPPATPPGAPQASTPSPSTHESSLIQKSPEFPRNEVGQIVVPAAAPRRNIDAPPTRAPYANEFVVLQETYLEANGWELIGRNDLGIGVWRDPVSAGDNRGIRTEMYVDDPNCPDGKLPQKEGPPVTLFQVVCPPVRWDLTTEQAVACQRSRDEAGKRDGDVTPLERIDRLSRQISAMQGAEAKVATDLELLLKRSVPDRIEAARGELTLLRRAIQLAAQRLKDGTAKTVAA